MKDAWDAESSEDEAEPVKEEPTPPPEEVKKQPSAEEKSKEVLLYVYSKYCNCDY